MIFHLFSSPKHYGQAFNGLYYLVVNQPFTRYYDRVFITLVSLFIIINLGAILRLIIIFDVDLHFVLLHFAPE